MVDKGTLFATTIISQGILQGSKQWSIVEGKMVSIRCAPGDIALYPLAEVNMEMHSNIEGVFSVVI